MPMHDMASTVVDLEALAFAALSGIFSLAYKTTSSCHIFAVMYNRNKQF